MVTASRDFVICGTCDLVVQPASGFAAHCSSTGHLARVEGNVVRCSICNKYPRRSGWTDHIRSRRHLIAADTQGLRVDIPYEVPASVPGHQKCHICEVFVTNVLWEDHKQHATHLKHLHAREEVDFMRETLRRATADKEGVYVSGVDGVDFGVVDISSAARGMRSILTVKTAPGTQNVRFIRGKAQPSSPLVSKKTFATSMASSSAIIHPDVDFQIVIHFLPSSPQIGRYSANLELLFEDTPRRQHFIIIRSVTAVIGNVVDFQATALAAPYQPRLRRPFHRIVGTNIIEGSYSKSNSRNPYAITLSQYYVPQALVDAFQNGPQDVSKVTERLPHEFRPVALSASNYVTSLKAQLWAEEYKATTDMHVFDMFDQMLERKGRKFCLVVPGLAEGRPSVIVGDSILVHNQNSDDDKWYQGVVQEVRSEVVSVLFARSFSGSPSYTYSIRFSFNRVPLRRQHQALHQPFSEDRILFPIKSHVKPTTVTNSNPQLFNMAIAKNRNQLLSVKTIMALPPSSHPFIVYGPPGTGKTVTIVEAMMQLLHTNSTTKILACAPSNSAADLIAERLLAYMNKKDLFRFYAPSRAPSLSPLVVLECARLTDGSFTVPSKTFASSFRVVVTTCVGAAFAHNIRMEPGHFDWIFIDEAGQGTEPEAMISIKGMAGPKTNIVLSGDPKQLRPVIRSPVAAELGLGKSFLERLMERSIYDESQGHGRTLVKLVQNFRSHPHILEFPSKTFYDGDLRSHADTRIVNSFVEWKHHPQPKKRFPIVFHAISGNDEQEASSPSYFNRHEASQVKSYIEMLRLDGLGAGDIGIITPYFAQAKKIRLLIQSIAPETKVGSVELFQGDERKVIVMSTVRSTQDLMTYDLRHTLGFVGNPRRFNVAMTRARALLIVVGDPAVLGLDPLWRAWLNWVYTRGGWTGSKGPSWDPEAEVSEAGGYDRALQQLGLDEMRALAARMEALSTGQNVVVEEDDDGAAYEVDPRDAE